MSIWCEALRDENGQGDMAYMAIGLLCIGALVSLGWVCLMVAIDYGHCINTPVTTIAKGEQSVTSIVPCRFDPLPLGQAAGLIFGAFAALIGSLAGYMAATKRRNNEPAKPAPGGQ